jgi:hypothetical protein
VTTNAFDPNRDHRISREAAASLVQAFHSSAKVGAHRATAFNRSAFEQLLAQPGAAGIRIYRAQHADGSPAMVLVAVGVDGEDIAGTDAVFMQFGTDCPPYCASQTWV